MIDGSKKCKRQLAFERQSSHVFEKRSKPKFYLCFPNWCKKTWLFFTLLYFFRNLTKVDLSYNAINNLSGLAKLHGPGFNLQTLYLQGNQLSSLDHVIHSLIGCKMLKELALSQYGEANPVCEIPGYRSSILRALKALEVLDGLDQRGNQAAMSDNLWSIPGTISDDLLE